MTASVVRMHTTSIDNSWSERLECVPVLNAYSNSTYCRPSIHSASSNPLDPPASWEQPIEALANQVEYLHGTARTDRRVDWKTLKGALYPGAHDDENALLETLCTDEFELAFAIRWLTALASRAPLLCSTSDGRTKLTSSFVLCRDQIII